MVTLNRVNCDIMKNLELKKEMMMYKFPSMGTEFIKSQIERYKQIFLLDKVNTKTLKSNEEFVFVGKKDAILTKDAIYMIYNLLDHIIELAKVKPVFVDIVYHKDLDGELSASLFYTLLNTLAKSGYNITIECSPYAYKPNAINNMCRWVDLYKNDKETVFIGLDIILTKFEIEKVISTFNHTLIVDHHPSSKEMMTTIEVKNEYDLQCIIDLRYSAAFLSYTITRDYIEKYCKIRLNDTLPTLVSIYDTRAIQNVDMEYIPVKLTEILRRKFIYEKKEVKFSLEDSSRVITKLNSRYFINSIVYIKNEIADMVDNYPISYEYGVCINLYYNFMGGLNAYTNIFQKIMCSDELLNHVIETGSKLNDLEKLKYEIVGSDEVFYLANKNGIKIVGTNSTNFMRIPNNMNKDASIRIVLDHGTMNMVRVKISIEDSILKSIDFRNEFKNALAVSVKGHMGLICFQIDINTIKKQLHDSILLHMNDTYYSTKFTMKGNGLRADPAVVSVFKILATIIMEKAHTSIQESIEKKYNVQ